MSRSVGGLAAGFLLVLTASLSAESSIDPSRKYAWAANVGWVNFEAGITHGVAAGGFYFSGYAWSANTGWIDFGDGSPANGHSYANNSSGDFGVNHDGAGNLSGYAYSANTGWINFGWASLSDSNRPRFDLQTGVFVGYAWSANTGWIHLGTGLLATNVLQSPDADADGIADAWEMLHFGTLTTAGPATDSDDDGVSDADEYAADTGPDDTGSYLRVVSQSFSTTPPGTNLGFGPTSPARLYRIEYSNDLGGSDPWTSSSAGTFPPDAGPLTYRTVTYPGNPKKFFRVVVVVPLSP
jgi:hypothetical protein